MPRFWQALVSIWVWIVLVITVLINFPLMVVVRLVTAPFDPGRYRVGRLFRWTCIVVAAANPLWRFRRSGFELRDPRRPYVVVSNHESFADILLISHLPWEMKWLSKAELFRIPFVGWMMSLAGDVPVRRGVGTSAVEAMRACRDRLERRVSVMIFPEGTRSPSGRLLPFKDGAFRLAVEAGVPVLPLTVVGTRNALPKKGWIMGRSVAHVRVLEPVETTGLTLADVPALRDRVRTLIDAAHAEISGTSRPAAEIPGGPHPADGAGEPE
jgi:1-acyl-sn-glycerol-3-phosphate acyltransferase